MDSSNSVLRCGICWECFNQFIRIPKILPCGHSFCEQCINELRTQSCPNCNVPFDYCSTNYQLLEQIELSESASNRITEMEELLKTFQAQLSYEQQRTSTHIWCSTLHCTKLASPEDMMVCLDCLPRSSYQRWAPNTIAQLIPRIKQEKRETILKPQQQEAYNQIWRRYLPEIEIKNDEIIRKHWLCDTCSALHHKDHNLINYSLIRLDNDKYDMALKFADGYQQLFDFTLEPSMNKLTKSRSTLLTLFEQHLLSMRGSRDMTNDEVSKKNTEAKIKLVFGKMNDCKQILRQEIDKFTNLIQELEEALASQEMIDDTA